MGESKEDVVDMLLELWEIQPEALPHQFPASDSGNPAGACRYVSSFHRLLHEGALPDPASGSESRYPLRRGTEVYFKGEEKMLLRVVDSIFASGYLTAGGQGIKDTIQTIEDAGFTYEIESA